MNTKSFTILHHLTMQTGDLARLPKPGGDAIWPQLRAIRGGGRLPPPLEDFWVEVSERGDMVMFTVFLSAKGLRARLSPPIPQSFRSFAVPMATCMCPLRPDRSELAWEILEKTYFHTTEMLISECGLAIDSALPERPPFPWLGAMPLPGLVVLGKDAALVGMFERYFGWSLLESASGCSDQSGA